MIVNLKRWEIGAARRGIGATRRGMKAARRMIEAVRRGMKAARGEMKAALGGALLGMLAGAALLAAGSAAAYALSGPARAHAMSVDAHAGVDAHAARALRATDTAHLHYVSASGSLLYEQGTVTGTLPGSMRVHFDVGATIGGTFTIYTRGGSIKGHGEATPHGSGVYESFAGTIVVTGGTGRYAHARGHTGLYGTFDRDNYALLVQTTGTLSF
jgi:hypothetical protein